MKGLILAGGRGTRLRPLSNTVAKQLIPVANRPILFYSLDTMREAGITQVGVVVGDHRAAIQDAVGDGSGFGLRVTYIEQSAPRGLAHAVNEARDFLGDDDFLMQLGDTVLLDSVLPLVEQFRAGRPAAALLLAKVSDPHEFGIAELGPDGAILSLVEKPRHPASDLAIVGVYAFTATIHQAVRAIGPSRRGEYEITDAVRWLLSTGHAVESRVTTGYWSDAGRLDDLLECNRVLLGRIEGGIHGRVDEASTLIGPVLVEEDACVTRSRIVGPAVIGLGSRVTDSVVGPHSSIGPGCEVVDSEVEASMLFDGAAVRGVRTLRHSLVGRRSQVQAQEGAHRVVVGDHDAVWISG
ncbi:glucose-1-phosphate thymidylyltransferase [Actinoplanes sp. N902-109]|uniref:glucose-1-phosphate thymidylyltransferase n=1 Tax=Actinoplanes sp. (strain N902-109) TaxID=649831 RepID=UPI0003293E9A|nr:glucose-1-phosphate thymidylyltransferase [Actinoplanes sp. N902-109]AGL16652.1 putative dNDP-glucose synthetase [Actinoplanes sp. N902-109]